MNIEFKARLCIDDNETFTNEQLQVLLDECLGTVCMSIDDVDILSQEE